MSHWFDGFSQVHRFELTPSADGSHVSEVTYNSRHTCDEVIEVVRKTGELGKISFGQKYDPCQSFFKKVMSSYTAATAHDPSDPTDANVGVTIKANLPVKGHVAGEEAKAKTMQTLWTKTDTAQMQLLDPKTLEVKEFMRHQVMNPSLKGPFAAAHLRTDPVTGDWYNFNLELGRLATYRIFRVSASTGEAEVLATISGADIKPAYIHSFMITENYILFCIYAAHLTKNGLAVLWYRNMLEAMEFDPKKKNIWLVIDRKGDKGVVGVYESDPFFAFHPVNAWEQPSEDDPSKVDIVTDIPVLPNIDILTRFYYNNLKSTSPTALKYVGDNEQHARASLTRFKIPSVGNDTVSISGKRGKVEQVSKAAVEESPELPTFDPRLACKPSRYIYGICDRGKSTFVDGLVKFDSQTLTSKLWSEHAHSPGEPIFIPNPDGTDEDDGVCLSVVLDGRGGKSYLLALDAKSFEEVGRAELEAVVSLGFHGSHVPM